MKYRYYYSQLRSLTTYRIDRCITEFKAPFLQTVVPRITPKASKISSMFIAYTWVTYCTTIYIGFGMERMAIALSVLFSHTSQNWCSVLGLSMDQLNSHWFNALLSFLLQYVSRVAAENACGLSAYCTQVFHVPVDLSKLLRTSFCNHAKALPTSFLGKFSISVCTKTGISRSICFLQLHENKVTERVHKLSRKSTNATSQKTARKAINDQSKNDIKGIESTD